MLNQVDAVGLQTLQRFVELPRGFGFRAAVDLRHQERLPPVAVAKRLAHADLAGAFVVVPAVVEEVDAAVDRAADDSKAEVFGDGFQTDVPAAEANG